MSTIKCPYSQKDYILQQNIRLYWTFYVICGNIYYIRTFYRPKRTFYMPKWTFYET